MDEKRARIIHMHVPKTAGTALRTAFKAKISDHARMFPHWDEEKYAGVQPEDYDFYSGHFGYQTAQRLQGEIITVLRNPVDRFVSVYYFWRELYEKKIETSQNTELAFKYKLEDFARIRDQPGLIEEFSNRCTYQIAYGSSLAHRRDLRQRGLTDDEIFAIASTNLASFAVVGVQENLSGFAASLYTRFNVSLSIGKINVTSKRPEVDDVPLVTRKAIQDSVFIDLELYQQALRLSFMESRLDDYPVELRGV